MPLASGATETFRTAAELKHVLGETASPRPTPSLTVLGSFDILRFRKALFLGIRALHIGKSTKWSETIAPRSLPACEAFFAAHNLLQRPLLSRLIHPC